MFLCKLKNKISFFFCKSIYHVSLFLCLHKNKETVRYKRLFYYQFMRKITVYGLESEITYFEAKGLSKVFNAYARYSDRETISDGGIGFNANSGAIYIALENGIQIVSFLGQAVIFMISDFETGEEEFFDTYKKALQKIEEN